MKILIIDGQGGKIGSLLTKYLKESYPSQELYVVGTNSIATSAMLKSGANFGATGENPVLRNAIDADIIIGPMGIIAAHSILGEVTPKMAEAVGGCHAQKILIPVTSCKITVAGTPDMQLSAYVRAAVDEIGKYIGNQQ